MSPNTILAISYAKDPDSDNEVLNSNVAGFVHVLQVLPESRLLTVTAPNSMGGRNTWEVINSFFEN